jgi:DNA-binding winged helix-turn-helix (wHTH) protein
MTAAAPTAEKRLCRFDGFLVDPERRCLLRDGAPVALTPKALSILLILLEKRGEVVDKDELLGRIWPDTFVTEANLTQNVSALRKALGEKANEHRYVVTMPGRGYSFVTEVTEVTEAEEAANVSDVADAPDTAVPGLPLPPEPSSPAPLPTVQDIPRGRRLPAILAVGLLLAAAAMLLLFLRARGTVPRASPAPRRYNASPSRSWDSRTCRAHPPRPGSPRRWPRC